MAGVTTRRAGLADAEPISALLMANSAKAGGELLGEWPVMIVRECIATDAVVLVALPRRADHRRPVYRGEASVTGPGRRDDAGGMAGRR